MSKIKSMCKFCVSQEGNICVKRKRRILLKKNDKCEFYQEDTTKLEELALRKLNSSKPKVTFRPEWYWNRKEVIKQLKEDERRRIENLQPSIFTGDPSHPLTGDLSRFFSSTVGEDKEG